MSLPREVIPGRFFMVTRRRTQRQFSLRPDAETNNAFLYCVAEAAQRLGIEILLTCTMSNHYRTVIFDRDGTIPAFTEHFHKLLAKCQNAWRGRWENFWASEQVCLVRLVDPADVMHMLVYVATNPVKDRLIDKVHHWPGQRAGRAARRAHVARDPPQALLPRRRPDARGDGAEPHPPERVRRPPATTATLAPAGSPATQSRSPPPPYWLRRYAHVLLAS